MNVSINVRRLVRASKIGAVALAAATIAAPALADSTGAITSAELYQDGYPFPSDPPADADHQDLVNYAWRLFIAANQLAGSTRGEASTSANFVDTGSSSSLSGPLVFESFYHRSEAYPYYSGSKPAQPSSSTSQQPTYYFQTITVTNGQWNNLDENNEIGQNALYFPKGSPHPSNPSEDSQVLFQAKVNQVELDYVYPLTSVPSNFSFPTTSPGTMEIKTAWRLASDIKCVAQGGSLQFLTAVSCEEAIAVTNASPPGGGQNYQPFNVPGDGVWETQDQTSGGQQPYRSEDGSQSFEWYSCSRYPNDCIYRYHTAMANYYTGDESNPTVESTEFALLALHIIVKTANHPTFMFTTFEQIDSVTDANGQATGLYYIPSYSQIEYLPSGSSQNPTATYTGAYTTIKPTTMASDTTSTTLLPPGGPVASYTTVIQPQTITSDAVNVNNHVHGLLPAGNVWQYYALKGVQSLETNTTGSGSSLTGDPTSPDYYLANIVVESSQPGVQLFKGGAPGPNTVGSATYLQPQLSSTNVTAPDGTNVTLGGCKGCHGVAQQGGTDFSFLVGGGLGNPGFSPDTLEEDQSIQEIKTKAAVSPRRVR